MLCLHKKTGLAAYAQVLGYEDPPIMAPETSCKNLPSLPANNEVVLPKAEEPQKPSRPSMSYLAHTQSEFHSHEKEDSSQIEAQGEEEAAPSIESLLDEASQPFTWEPLARWSSVWPRIRAALSQKRSSSKIDYQALRRSLARLKPPKHIPYQSIQRWSEQATVCLDFSKTLEPVHDDMLLLHHQIECLRGKQGLLAYYLSHGPYEGFYPLNEDAEIQELPANINQGPLLICSDLGCYDTSGRRSHSWLAFGAWLKRSFGLTPTVLMPCPPRYWRKDLEAYYQLVYWDRGVKNSGIKAKSTSKASEQESTALAAYLEQQGKALLARAAPATRVEYWLLRALRFNTPGFDIGHEIAACLSPDVHAFPRGFTFSTEALGPDESKKTPYERAFEGLSEEEQTRIYDLILGAHSSLPADVKIEEKLNYLIYRKQDYRRVLHYLLNELPDNNAPAEQPWVQQTREWEKRLFERLPASVQKHHPKAYNELLKNADAQYQRANKEPSTKVFFANLLANPEGKTQRLNILQYGSQLHMKAQNPNQGGRDQFSAKIASLDIPDGMAILKSSSPGAKAQVLRINETPIEVSKEHNTLIRGVNESVTLSTMQLPAWAKSLSRRDGELIAEYADINQYKNSKQKAYWCPPGRYPVFNAQESSTQQTSAKEVLEITQGFYWHQNAYQAFKEAGGFIKPNWAETFGLDEYGIYADLNLAGVTQRFRWIRPGRFLMGSPEDEPGRRQNETQHQVTLTKDFWLAETACTQELWTAVVGKNPSYFNRGIETAQYPVEYIRPRDCLAFITRARKYYEDIPLRLPTEAEWEYACRAGTSTPFSFGHVLTPDHANYSGSRPYINQAKGKGRSQIIEVKSFSPNSWGLYQMHGNVWEWCQDKYVRNLYGPACDPLGSEGGEARVRRGGCWDFEGRWLRSAARDDDSPHFVLTGFRLAIG